VGIARRGSRWRTGWSPGRILWPGATRIRVAQHHNRRHSLAGGDGEARGESHGHAGHVKPLRARDANGFRKENQVDGGAARQSSWKLVTSEPAEKVITAQQMA